MAGVSAATEPNTPSSGWSPAQLALHVVHPPEVAGKKLPLRPNLLIGRDAGSDAIAHSTVSRRHASVTAKPNGFWVEDLASRNGTRINGSLICEPAFLLPDTVVRFGDVFAIVGDHGDAPFDPGLVLPGTTEAMARARELLYRAAPEAAPVLVTGETGVGKERVALEVHRASGRRGPCLTLNCAALSRDLIESQLFGHRRGAFTGANTSADGLFTAAHGGTLYLDEIGELPLELQPKLLRVLEDGQVRPVGSVETRAVDVRVVAATNRDLAAWVETGGFRRDLYARLSLWEIRIPPLRERRQDLLHWWALLAAAHGVSGQDLICRLHPDAVERILIHAFPDNLRGLNRVVHRLSALGEPQIGLRVLGEQLPELVRAPAGIRAEPLPRQSEAAPPEARSPSQPPPSREELLAVLEATGFNVRATSKHFGRDRRQIYRWLDSYGIARPDR